ncbi:hypothetical protein D3C76_1451400 [compost metagenome]
MCADDDLKLSTALYRINNTVKRFKRFLICFSSIIQCKSKPSHTVSQSGYILTTAHFLYNILSQLLVFLAHPIMPPLVVAT